MSRALRKLDKELETGALGFSMAEQVALPAANIAESHASTRAGIFTAARRATSAGDGEAVRRSIEAARRHPQLKVSDPTDWNAMLDGVLRELDAADPDDAEVAHRREPRATSTSPQIARTGVGRLFEGQTSIDFVGRRKIGLVVSSLLIVATVVSLLTQGLNLGIDFEGGISWDVPATNGFTVDDAEAVLADNGLSTEGARLQERSVAGGDTLIKVQVGDQPETVGAQLREDFAEAAGVPVDDVNVNLVSSSWGSEITTKALEALAIFIALVALFISIRFEWRMALAAIVAMVHDVLISVGIYSIFQFIVTPPTVIAFLTILGYSLYDTIVVFDRVRENEARFAAQKPPYDDIINVSMNQVLMRSLNTSFSSIVPVISLLLIGAGVLGQSTLAEFALALLVGMLTGAYSSIFIAAPLLGVLKKTDANWRERNIPRAVGDALRDMVMGGDVGSRRTRALAAERGARAAAESEAAPAASGAATTTAVRTDPASDTTAKKALSHPPRPRKKKRR